MLRRIVAAAAAVVLLSAPALAQTRSDQDQHQSQSRKSDSDKATKDLSLLSEKDVKGATIKNTTGEKIGTVDHVVMDQASGKVKYAVVGVGGFLGMGQKDVAVPWDRFQPGNEEQSFVLNADKETLRNAPSVDMKNLQALTQQQTQTQITSYWQKAASQQAQTPQKGQKKSTGD